MKGMKTGVVTQFHADKGVGTIYVPSVVGERYFFYQNKIVAGPMPRPGSKVMFYVSSTKIPKPGRLPYAENIIVMADDEQAIFNAFKSDDASEVSS